MRLLLIDNYDSFTYNLAQYFAELGAQVEVLRNDQMSLDEFEAKFFNDFLANRSGAICLSPGPCTPKEAGVCVPLVERWSGKIPLLGVCLGHQSIAAAFDGKIVRAQQVMHGKCDEVFHDQSGVFQALPSPFRVVRYHSLVAEQQSLSPVLRPNAWSSDREIMGFVHEQHPTHGVQFHPESILTEHGKALLKNFMDISDAFWAKKSV
jgi:anthranilate synthase component 2